MSNFFKNKGLRAVKDWVHPFDVLKPESRSELEDQDNAVTK